MIVVWAGPPFYAPPKYPQHIRLHCYPPLQVSNLRTCDWHKDCIAVRNMSLLPTYTRGFLFQNPRIQPPFARALPPTLVEDIVFIKDLDFARSVSSSSVLSPSGVA